MATKISNPDLRKAFWLARALMVCCIVFVILLLVSCGDNHYHFEDSEEAERLGVVTTTEATTTTVGVATTEPQRTTTTKSPERLAAEQRTQEAAKRGQFEYRIYSISLDLDIQKDVASAACDQFYSVDDAIDCAQQIIVFAEIGLQLSDLSVEIGNYYDCPPSFFSKVNEYTAFNQAMVDFQNRFIAYANNGGAIHEFPFDQSPVAPDDPYNVMVNCFDGFAVA